MSGEAILSAENGEKIFGRSGLRLEPHWGAHSAPQTSDVVWDRRSQDKTGQRLKKSVLFLVLQVLCCVVKYNLVTLVVIMISVDTAAFQVLVWFLYFVLGTSLLWRSTVTFTYLKAKSAKCLCLLPVVLVLFFRSWSCYGRTLSDASMLYFADVFYIFLFPP